MAEPKGREDEVRDSEGGALPEGARIFEDEGLSADPAQGDGVQAFRGSSRSAGALDLAAIQDEPTQLIRLLMLAAQEHIGYTPHEMEWKVLLGHFERANNELIRLQNPSHKPVKHGTL